MRSILAGWLRERDERPVWFPAQPTAGTVLALAEAADELPLPALYEFFRAAARLPEGGRAYLWARGQEARRPLRHYQALALHFRLRLAWPELLEADDSAWVLRCETAAREPLWPPASAPGEAYASGDYASFDKLEEAEIYLGLREALERALPEGEARILSLGIHDGSEWEVLHTCPRATPERWTLFGIDTCREALVRARRRFPDRSRTHLLQADAARAPELGVPPCDLVLCLNTLQSRQLDRDALLRGLKAVLRPRCRVLFSLPHCHLTAAGLHLEPYRRYLGRPERSLALKDARYLARYLYRSGFQSVEIFGTAYLYILGRRS